MKCEDHPHRLQAKWIDECFLQETFPFVSSDLPNYDVEKHGEQRKFFLAFDYYVCARPYLFFWWKIPSVSTGSYDYSAVVAMKKDTSGHDAFFATNRRTLAHWWFDAVAADHEARIYVPVNDLNKTCADCVPPRNYSSVHADLASGLSFGCCPEIILLYLPRWGVRVNPAANELQGCIARDYAHLDCHRKSGVIVDAEAEKGMSLHAQSPLPDFHAPGGSAQFCETPSDKHFYDFLRAFGAWHSVA